MILFDKKADIPEYCYHKPEIQDGKNVTMAMRFINAKKLPPWQWIQDPSIKHGSTQETVAMLLIDQDMEIPENCYHSPEIQDYNGKTVAMKYAEKGQIPPKQWHHDPNIQSITHQKEIDNNQQYKTVDYKDQTVAMILVNQHGIIPPKEWEHNSILKQFNGKTVAMLFADRGIVPPSQWEHDPLITSKRENTVAMLLADKGVIPPKQWLHKNDLMCKFYYSFGNQDTLTTQMTVAMLLANHGIVAPEMWHHDPELQDQLTYKTVGLILAEHGIIPPNQWCTNKYYRPPNGKTVKQLLQQKQIKVPDEYFYDDCILQQIDQYKSYIIKCGFYTEEYIQRNYYKHLNNIIQRKDYYNGQNKIKSFAMFLAKNGIQPPQDFNHKPDLTDDKYNTVAIYLLENHLNVPKHWQYDPLQEICFQYNAVQNTIQILIQNNIIIPKWGFDPSKQDIHGKTIAHYYAYKGIDPPCYTYHDPKIQDKNGNTVAMALMLQNKIPADCWIHDPNIKNNDDKCFLILYIDYYMQCMTKNHNNNVKPQFQYKLKINKRWYPNPLYIFNNNTMAFNLAQKDFEIPLELCHNPKFVNSKNQTVAMIIAQHGWNIPKEWEHDPQLFDIDHRTVSYYIYQSGKSQIPLQWQQIQPQQINDDKIIKQYQEQQNNIEQQSQQQFEEYEEKDVEQIETNDQQQIQSQQQNKQQNIQQQNQNNSKEKIQNTANINNDYNKIPGIVLLAFIIVMLSKVKL